MKDDKILLISDKLYSAMKATDIAFVNTGKIWMRCELLSLSTSLSFPQIR